MEDGREMIESIYLPEAGPAQGPLACCEKDSHAPPAHLHGGFQRCLSAPFSYSGAFPAFLLDQGLLESREIALFIFVSTGMVT